MYSPQIVNIEKINTRPLERDIEFRNKDLVQLAQDAGVVRIDKCSAHYTLIKNKTGIIEVVGHIKADVVQSCILSLDEINSHIDETFKALFSTEKVVRQFDEEGAEIVSFEDDVPEEIENNTIDLNEITLQYLILFLDPYPRKDGINVDVEEFSLNGKESPFAKLAGLKLSQKGKKSIKGKK